MDVEAYLQRIKYEGAREPTYETLRALHLAHLCTVPFENLDVHLGRPITLDLDKLYDKIVVRRRGGFCYELNGLFAWLLIELGFGVTRLSASDAQYDGEFGPEFDHLTLDVEVTGEPGARWLADVGWGDSFPEPLCHDEPGEQPQGLRAYRIEREVDFHLLWQRDYDGQWERQYRFTRRPRELADFAEMCRYHQTSPESPFVKKRVVTLATAEGRVTLDERRLIITEQGIRRELPVEDEADYRRILEERFGITI